MSGRSHQVRQARIEMKIICENKLYSFECENEGIYRQLLKMLPIEMTLSPSEEHEFYGILPDDLDTKMMAETSYVEGSHVYYFKDWNAFSLNYKDTDIRPYKVFVIGEMDHELNELLKTEKGRISIRIKE